MEGFVEDISERKRLVFLLRLQADLALTLGSASSMNEAMERLLESVMQVEGIDAGGEHWLDARNEELRRIPRGTFLLVYRPGLLLRPRDAQMRLVMQGEPDYLSDVGSLLEKKGLHPPWPSFP